MRTNRHYLIYGLLAVVTILSFLSANIAPSGKEYLHREDGFLVTNLMDSDQEVLFFCKKASATENGIYGTECIDLHCRRYTKDGRASVVLKEGWILPLNDFNPKEVRCGRVRS